MKLSIVINLDTRSQNDLAEHMFAGCVNTDFLVDGVVNKIQAFDGFDKEVIVYIDEHNAVEVDIFRQLSAMCDTLCIRKHTSEINFNDWNYLRALQLATGDIVIHFDGDASMFSKSKEATGRFLDLLNSHDFVSYPSYWSPTAVHDETFDHVWCSTRFFMCKRSSFDFEEIIKCANDYQYWCERYPVNRKCFWLEHWIGSIAKYREQSVYYPPLDLDNIAIFSWGSYKSGTLKQLNEMDYEQVKQWIYNHPIHYPVDIDA